MKTISIFILALYWSLIILAPVLAKNNFIKQSTKLTLPAKKPIN